MIFWNRKFKLEIVQRKKAHDKIEEQYAIISKERERSDNLLHNILPQEVAAELKATGASEAKDFDNVTVLFTDFVEFTQKAEKLAAKELVGEINTCFKAFDEIMTKYKLEKIKTIGDAYMAAGGLHVPRTSEPKDVVKAGIEMQAFMLSRKAEREKAYLPYFEMRVGVHTGPVVAGIVGVKKFQYDIWGDTVNTASRMESNGTIGKVNISSKTYALLKNDDGFKFEEREEIEVKGKGIMKMYYVSRS
jgi:class 3 adenylate cyclase